VRITRVRTAVYDIHIAVPWHGTVGIAMPLRRHAHEAILHDVGGLWVPEGPRAGLRTVWVTQLSWFSTLAGKGITAIKNDLCLVFTRSAFIECVVKKGISHIDGKLASWIISKLPKSCWQHILEAGLLGGGPVGEFVAALNDPACVGTASSPGWTYPSGPTTVSPDPDRVLDPDTDTDTDANPDTNPQARSGAVG
jgi:hypothetical protein